MTVQAARFGLPAFQKALSPEGGSKITVKEANASLASLLAPGKVPTKTELNGIKAALKDRSMTDGARNAFEAFLAKYDAPAGWRPAPAPAPRPVGSGSGFSTSNAVPREAPATRLGVGGYSSVGSGIDRTAGRTTTPRVGAGSATSTSNAVPREAPPTRLGVGGYSSVGSGIDRSAGRTGGSGK